MGAAYERFGSKLIGVTGPLPSPVGATLVVAPVSGRCVQTGRPQGSPLQGKRGGRRQGAVMSDPALPRQLSLGLGHRESFDRADFLCGPGNETALTLIDRWTDWPARAIALIGPEGSGKSHLAAIWAKAAGGCVIAGGAIDAASVPQALSSGALAIEDADRGALDE